LGGAGSGGPPVVLEVGVLHYDHIAGGDGDASTVDAIRRCRPAVLVMDQVIHHDRATAGDPASRQSRITVATGDVVVVQDADLEYDPADLPNLLLPIRSRQATPCMDPGFQSGPRRVLYFWHYVGNRFLTLLSNMFTNLNLTDSRLATSSSAATCSSGCRSRPIGSASRSKFTARLAQARARIWEIPISYNGRTYAEGKKITWRDGFAALFHILRYNVFVPRNVNACAYQRSKTGLVTAAATLAVGILTLNQALVGVFYDDGLYAGLANGAGKRSRIRSS